MDTNHEASMVDGVRLNAPIIVPQEKEDVHSQRTEDGKCIQIDAYGELVKQT